MKPKSQPSITVAIAGHNSAEYLPATLESLGRQSLKPTQVVYFDDGSTDGSAAIANAFRDQLPMLDVFESSKCLGISAARNRANSHATSEYIAVLDADDLFDEDAIQNYAEFLADHPNVDLTYADTSVFAEELSQAHPRRYPRFDTNLAAIRHTLGSPLLPFKHSSMIYKRDSMEKLGGYDESLPMKVDIDLFLRFQSEGMKVEKLDQITSYHRKHEGQISAKRVRGLKTYSQLMKRYEPNPTIRGFLYASRYPSEMAKLVTEELMEILTKFSARSRDQIREKALKSKLDLTNQ